MKRILKLVVLAVVFILAGNLAFAGLPLNNLEGVGGVAFNPLAYLAKGDALYKIRDTEIISKPRFGTWYINLADPKIDWGAVSTATTLFGRLEVSEGYENAAWEGHGTLHKNSVGGKVLLLDENAFDTQWIPAVSVGTIYKTTSDKVLRDLGLPTRGSGEDWYAVASKTITQLPLPVVLSSGVLSSQEYVTGVLGFDNKRKITAFENVDVVLPHGFAVGYEFKQGEQYATIKNSNYWDVHVAWLATKNLTLVAAYTDTGSYGKTGNTRTGLGSGPVISAQYAF